MRFNELMLRDPEGELRIRFHPELTVLSGLGPTERRALSDGILGSLTGGQEDSILRYFDGMGRPVTIRSEHGQVAVRHADGGPGPTPLGTLAPDAESLRAIMVAAADDLGVLARSSREDEPPELREARDMLDDLTAQLDAALAQQQAMAATQTELEAVEQDLRAARDGVARREYAQVLAQLERVRAEAAALQSGAAGIESDQHLLASAGAARDLAVRWQEASALVAALAHDLDGQARLEPEDRDRIARIPAEEPPDLAVLVATLQQTTEVRDSLDQRLQALSVSKLPAPSEPAVAELGLLDQEVLWSTAERLEEATEELGRVQLSLGGLELDEMGPPPAVIDEIETAHSKVEEAERSANTAKVPGMAGTGLGVAAGVIGLAVAPVLLPVGLAGAAVAAGAGLVRPRARRARAARTEQAALERADATSYLAFHIRRVEASVDPKLREVVETALAEHRLALAAWEDLVGPDLEVVVATARREEIEAYNEALRNLGETAEELEQLRRELDEQAEPNLASARDRVLAACRPYLLDDLEERDPRSLPAAVAEQCRHGVAARLQVQIDEAEVDEQKASAALDDLLLELGFDAGPLDARVGALEWAVSRATEREEARDRARPRDEIEDELLQLQAMAARLHRPEWDAVTAAEASSPDIAELEARRNELATEVAAGRAEVDVERLADRQAAVERRVAALETRLGGPAANGDPGAIADMQQHLLAHLTTASQAGPDGDPVPVILDEVFHRVPADRKWDLLDLLHRLAEKHQVIYLSDDAFVAAWARQRASDGAITLLELAPEPA